MTLLSDVIGESLGITAIRDTIGRLLQRASGTRRLPPVLIQGETGTGKGLVARELHRAGPRASAPFVDVNCAAIPATLVEAEMLGFERGAFTDAHHAKPGLFQAAHQGTIFLDEVGLLPEGVQTKLLKVIEEREVRRLGSTRSEPVDTWILTATSENLLTATRERRFREDLYHRIAVLTIWLPPLRERGRDVLLLAEHFLARACVDYDLPPKRLSDEARAALLGYTWPGNVRELANVMERVALLSEAAEVTAEALGLPSSAARFPEKPEPTATPRLSELEGGVERERLLEVLTKTRWNISRAAATLGVPRNTLRYRLRKQGLRPSDITAPRGPGKLAPAGHHSSPSGSVARPAPAGLRWQRRRLTLVRATLSGESAAADFPPDGSRPLEVLVEKLLSFGGRIEELSPRGIMAAFGIEPVEDAPTRAALAAMAIQRAATRAQPRDVERFGVKLALHVGQFMLGRVGDTTDIESEAKREAWAVLDELLLRAERDTVLVSGAAVPFLERRFDLVAVDLTSLGQSAYRLGRFDVTGLRHGGRLATFVGRQPERVLLQRHLDTVLRGRGQLVGIAGDAGMGKSRLLFEFRQDLIGRGVSCLEGHCLSYATMVPYLPVLDIVQATCAVTDSDSPEAIADKVRTALGALTLEERTAAPLMLQLLGLAPPADSPGALTPEELKARTYEVLREMILRQSRQRPVVLIVEDVHWIDRTSEEYFTSLADAVAAAPVLIVTTYRPGYRPPWMGKSYATEMALQPLALHDSLALVRSVLRAARPGHQLEELIVAKGEGNPFFLEELAWALRDLGQDSRGPTLVVPDTVEEVILARIDRLPPAERSLLQECAVIGREVPLALLQAVTDMPPEELRDGLSTLRAGEFLLETGATLEPAYTFKHALTNDVAYASLSSARRRALHAYSLAALERLHSGRLAERVEELAHHALGGELHEKAVEYLRQAGAKAALRSASTEAVARFEQALDALQHLPESRARTEHAIDLHLEAGGARLAAGGWAKSTDHVREAEALAEALGDERRQGRALVELAIRAWTAGDPDRALELGQRALALAHEDVSLEIDASQRLGMVWQTRGNYREAVERLNRVAEALQGDRLYEQLPSGIVVSVFTRDRLAWCLAELGEFAEAIARAEEAVRIARQLDGSPSVVPAHRSLGLVFLRRGDVEQAIPPLERAVELCRVIPARYFLDVSAAHLGYAYALAGRLPEGVALMETALANSAATGNANHPLFLAYLGEAHLLAGRREDATAVARRALDLAHRQKERGNEAWVLRLLGEIATETDIPDRETAEAHYGRALARADELGMRPLVTHCHLGLGKLYRRHGDRTNARKHLTTATTFYREMDMGFYLAQAEAALAELG
jgi:DNA-binding NtrC family response regulator/tetratricopeptide (TPR) repeat protein